MCAGGQETHCTTANKLVIPNFSLAGSLLSRKHGLATLLYEQLKWSLADQSPEQSETEWLFIDVAGYKIINVYKRPHSQLKLMAIPTFPHPSLYAGNFNCEILIGATEKYLLMVRTWTPGQHQTTLGCCTTQREQPVSLVTNGTLAPWPSQMSARTTYNWQTCFRKVLAVTTSALPHNARKTQGSWPQWSVEALELPQRWLQALLPSCRWIHWDCCLRHNNQKGISKILKLGYNPSLFIFWITCWGFGFKSYDLK